MEQITSKEFDENNVSIENGKVEEMKLRYFIQLREEWDSGEGEVDIEERIYTMRNYIHFHLIGKLFDHKSNFIKKHAKIVKSKNYTIDKYSRVSLFSYEVFGENPDEKEILSYLETDDIYEIYVSRLMRYIGRKNYDFSLINFCYGILKFSTRNVLMEDGNFEEGFRFMREDDDRLLRLVANIKKESNKFNNDKLEIDVRDKKYFSIFSGKLDLIDEENFDKIMKIIVKGPYKMLITAYFGVKSLEDFFNHIKEKLPNKYILIKTLHEDFDECKVLIKEKYEKK